MKSVDLNLLIALDALLEEGSVSGAAERMRTSTPTMSQPLARLRRAFGDPLEQATGLLLETGVPDLASLKTVLLLGHSPCVSSVLIRTMRTGRLVGGLLHLPTRAVTRAYSIPVDRSLGQVRLPGPIHRI
ncbi:LysR family transcriptional regulator [Streptomyces sp. NPDC086554]|uniref:LysR family transcriptional regulator n=1 Tax=Streptomyces sp. NPDC086554 TaxID=3154864 RepID=UPI003426FAE4